MKLDMGLAWNDAVAKLAANKEVVAVVAGVFFFLPYFALMLFLPAEMAALQSGSAQPEPEKLMEILKDFYLSYWWVFILIAVAQGIGTLGLMALLSDRSRPTLGQALAAGAKMFVPFFAAQLLIGFGLGLLVILPIALGAASGSVALAVILGLIAVVIAVYLYVKFSLTAPAFAIERTMNPIHALRSSWQATKGNSLMIFLFYLLLIIAYVVVSSVISMIFGLIFALMGTDVAMVGNGFVSSVMNAVYATIMAAIMVAIYLQLTGGSKEEVSETFE